MPFANCSVGLKNREDCDSAEPTSEWRSSLSFEGLSPVLIVAQPVPRAETLCPQALVETSEHPLSDYL